MDGSEERFDYLILELSATLGSLERFIVGIVECQVEDECNAK